MLFTVGSIMSPMRCRGACFALLIMTLQKVVTVNPRTHPKGVHPREIKYSINEDSPPNYKVGNVPFDASIIHSSHPDTKKVVCKFLSQDSPYQEYFRLENNTGELLTAMTIDREVVCPNAVECRMTVVIAVKLNQFPQIVKVSVDILDINDNSPEFPSNVVEKTLPESATPGRLLSLSGAVDLDSPRFGIKDYRLEKKNDKFKLHYSKEEGDLQLLLDGELDREVENFYSMRVIAFDGGVPSKTGTLTVNIKVLDTNDNNPKFNASEYTFTSNENVPAMTVLGRVWANDLDEGANGEVLYAFDSASQRTYGEQFGIEDTTGVIYLRGTLDYEKKKVYQLRVTSRDKGPIPLTDVAKVIISVKDVNDHAPEIKVHTLSYKNTAEISEFTPLGMFVAHVATSDPDTGNNGKYECDLDSKVFMLRLIDTGEYEIITLQQMDREARDTYNVTLKCNDSGSPPMSSSQLITIRIKDENDNYPSFTGSPYSASIKENNYVGASITQVTATDRDSGLNGLITYEIDETASEWVNIDHRTGIIQAKAIFDFELQSQFQFSVIAKDSGNPRRSTSVKVMLYILDVNDVAPKFESNKYPKGLLENQPAGSSIAVFTASDDDSEPHNIITYHLDGRPEVLSIFSIDKHSGKLVSRKVLDREQNASYTFSVLAKDSGTPVLSGKATVVVYVGDMNDNDPIIDYPNPVNDTVTISPKIPVNYEILRVIAHDMDVGENSKLTFSIYEDSEESYFEIHKWQAKLTLKRKLTLQDDQRVFYLVITVRDEGKPQRESKVDLKIVVDKREPYFHIEPATDLVVISTQNTLILVTVAVIAFFVIMFLLAMLVYVQVKQKRSYRSTEYVYCGTKNTEQKDLNWQDLLDSMGKFSAGKDDYDISPDDWKSVGTGKSNKSNSLNRGKDNYLVVHRHSGEKQSHHQSRDNVTVKIAGYGSERTPSGSLSDGKDQPTSLPRYNKLVQENGTLKLEGALEPPPPPRPRPNHTVLTQEYFRARPTQAELTIPAYGEESDPSDCYNDVHTGERRATSFQSDTSYENAPNGWRPRSGLFDTSDDNTMESNKAVRV